MRASPARGVTGKDAALLCLVIAAAACLHAPVLFGGRVYFTNDLTHVGHPWRVLTAQQLQQGQAPLWNPYAYFGLPLLATMQTGLFYPLSLAFHLFPFSRALGWYLFANYALGAAWVYLWMRRWAFARLPCMAASAVFILGGCAQGFLQFPNLLAAVLQLPGFLLFSDQAALLGLVSAWAFLAGYPPAWAGSAACMAVLRGLWPFEGRRAPRAMAAGLLLGLAISCAVLVPGLELARRSNRSEGLPSAERMNNSLHPEEFSAFIHPGLTRALDRMGKKPEERKDEIVWTRGGRRTSFTFYSGYPDPVGDPSGAKFSPWKSCYIGFAASLLALIGAARLFRVSPGRSALLAAAGAAAAVLMLGSSTRVSLWLWENFPPLRHVRGPGRWTYLPLAGLVPLAALGLESIRRAGPWRAILAAMVLAELAWTGRGFYPTLPADYYRQRGALVDFLRANLGEARYFMIPSTEAWAYVDKDDPSADYRDFREMVFNTYKQKLFGIGNAVFHLSAAAGGYESLFPWEAGALIESLRRADKAALAPRLRRAGIRFWLDRGGPSPAGLADRGTHLWRAFEVPGAVSVAYGPPGGAPWAFRRVREDRLLLSGDAGRGGELFLAEPYYPGWGLYVNGGKAALRAAEGPFVACDVPAGEVSAVWLYRPLSWRIGVLASVLALSGLAWSGRRRLAA